MSAEGGGASVLVLGPVDAVLIALLSYAALVILPRAVRRLLAARAARAAKAA